MGRRRGLISLYLHHLEEQAKEERRRERAARRQQRELEAQEKEYQKMVEATQAKYTVDVYENTIERLTSLHKECTDQIKWHKLALMKAPKKPKRKNEHESAARNAFENHKPNFLKRILGISKKEKGLLQENIEDSINKDEDLFQAAISDFHRKYIEWEEAKEYYQDMLKGDLDTYSYTLQEMDPFRELDELGSTPQVTYYNSLLIGSHVNVHSQSIIPGKIHSLTKTGKLSSKQMPKTKFFDYYQDYVASAVFRVARELFAILPIDTAIVTATDDIRSSKTGHLEETPILSVEFQRNIIEHLNFNFIDPSDALDNFKHHMLFRKTQGFLPVAEIEAPIQAS